MDIEYVVMLIVGIIVFALLVFGLSGGCSRNVDLVKANAAATFDQAGFEIVGCQGYLTAPIAGGTVYYILKKKGNDKLTYSAGIQWWYGEYHIYDLRAMDAIQP